VLLRDGSTLHRTAPRFGWTTSTAREFGFSISPERGVRAGATAEMIRKDFGSSGNATTTTADVRAYIPVGIPHHVLALRAAGGISNGDVQVRRVFSVGGARSNPSVLDFGSDAFSLLRGFERDAALGTRIAIVNADYRWPLARPERGLSTLPFFFHTVHAAVFADAGDAWNGRVRVKTSVGAELSVDVVVGYSVRLAVTAGTAWTRDGARSVATTPAFYARVGRAF
jgi:outer membrane protein assembly factor BamA